MANARISEWLFVLIGFAFIACVFLSMFSLWVMTISANIRLPKGKMFYFPIWPKQMNTMVEEHRRVFPNSFIYRIFAISTISAAIFAGLGLVIMTVGMFLRGN